MFITHDLDEALRIGDTIAILRDGAVIQQGEPQQIIMHPEDDYIFDFIKDINRGRVIKIGTLMAAPNNNVGPDIDRNMVLEDALQQVASSPTQECNVVDSVGTRIGSISLTQIVAGLARPDVEATPDARYR